MKNIKPWISELGIGDRVNTVFGDEILPGKVISFTKTQITIKLDAYNLPRRYMRKTGLGIGCDGWGNGRITEPS